MKKCATLKRHITKSAGCMSVRVHLSDDRLRPRVAAFVSPAGALQQSAAQTPSEGHDDNHQSSTMHRFAQPYAADTASPQEKETQNLVQSLYPEKSSLEELVEPMFGRPRLWSAPSTLFGVTAKPAGKQLVQKTNSPKIGPEDPKGAGDWPKISKVLKVLPVAEYWPMKKRDAILTELNARYDHPSAPFNLWQSPDLMSRNQEGNSMAVYSSKWHDFMEVGGVWTVKMWGFAGMTEMANPILEYERATRELITLIETLYPNVHARCRMYPGNLNIVLHFDGDAACDKLNAKQPVQEHKFSHALFAPLVAELLQAHFPLIPVHLLITKVDDQPPDAILRKFADPGTGTSVPKGAWGIRQQKDHVSAPRHFYPNFNSRVFYSCAIAVLQHASTHEASEFLNQQLVEKTLQRQHIEKRFCLNVGGNTVRGVEAYANAEFTFTGVVRIPFIKATQWIASNPN